MNLFRTTRCRIHDRDFESDTVPIRYGLIRFRNEFLNAKKSQFPHAKLFVIGGCRVRTEQIRDVFFCPECRDAEKLWNVQNPDFDTRADVFVTVQTQRRSLYNSLGKRILRNVALDKPERLQQYHWIVYRLSLDETVMYNSLNKTYTFPYRAEDVEEFHNVHMLAEHLTSRFG